MFTVLKDFKKTGDVVIIHKLKLTLFHSYKKSGECGQRRRSRSCHVSVSCLALRVNLSWVKTYHMQGCQHYRFFHRTTEFREWSVFLQIFIRSFKIFRFFTDFEIFWFFKTFFPVIGNHHSYGALAWRYGRVLVVVWCIISCL